MTGIEATTLARRLELHLRKNNFVVCGEILDEAENEYNQQCEDRFREVTAIAELKISLTTIAHLEKKGYVYIRQLDGIDVKRLHKEIKHLGRKDAFLLWRAIEKAKAQNQRIRQDLELSRLEQ